MIVATTSIGQSKISKRDFWNICGRAGRAFVDSEGKVLFAIDMTGKPWQVRNAKAAAKEYFNAALLDKVDSGLLYVVGRSTKLQANQVYPRKSFWSWQRTTTLIAVALKKDEVLGFLD
ncbi:MAG: hypothetical protein IPL59_15395 [Candidatus Competibacteraceae bacterium]|nr:hypothetical protein [Candidatus Competibacteraceae bacterium]